jgi:DNA-directed RNA polymerase subunit RPC12/RpoP
MNQTISVMYSCAACGIDKVSVAVPARQQEDVKYWVEKVMAQAISDDHSVRSPHCASRTMSKVMIPITGADKVGGVPVN